MKRASGAPPMRDLRITSTRLALVTWVARAEGSDDSYLALVNLAGLSFLGLGVQPGTPDWGRMLFENRNILFSNPVALLLPAAMIILTAVSMNLIGDWLAERWAK